MSLSFKHAFTNPQSDSANSTITRPSDWNNEHTVALTGPKLVGRTTASQGAAAEIALAGSVSLVSDTLSVIVPGSTNAEITESHVSSAATFALKTTAGADAATTDPITVLFGDGTTLSITAALSVVIPSTALMGARNGIPFRLWFVLISDSGTARLGVRNCVTTVAGAGTGSLATAINGFPDHGTLSSTIINTSSDSAGVTYTDVAVTTMPFSVLGYADYDSGLATAGTWDVSPSRIVMYGCGVQLPGTFLQCAISLSGTRATGSTATPVDNTIPQIGEGTQIQSQAITATSVNNLFLINAQAIVGNSGVDTTMVYALHNGANNALAASLPRSPSVSANRPTTCSLSYLMLTASTSAVTFTTRIGDAAGGTIEFNGYNAAAIMGTNGVCDSYLQIQELMG